MRGQGLGLVGFTVQWWSRRAQPWRAILHATSLSAGTLRNATTSKLERTAVPSCPDDDSRFFLVFLSRPGMLPAGVACKSGLTHSPALLCRAYTYAELVHKHFSRQAKVVEQIERHDAGVIDTSLGQMDDLSASTPNCTSLQIRSPPCRVKLLGG